MVSRSPLETAFLLLLAGTFFIVLVTRFVENFHLSVAFYFGAFAATLGGSLLLLELRARLRSLAPSQHAKTVHAFIGPTVLVLFCGGSTHWALHRIRDDTPLGDGIMLGGILLLSAAWSLASFLNFRLYAREIDTYRIDQVLRRDVHPVNRSYEFDAFISHANEDKDAIVRALVQELSRRGCRLWYDETVLQVGDSLRRSIDHGLARSRFGIVILSKAFLHKNWPRYELDGLTTRQVNDKKVILPVWHGVTYHDIAEYSPSLADTLAIDSSEMSVKEMGQALDKVLHGE